MTEWLNKGPRHARICPVKDCQPRWRSFGDPTAKCPEHRRGVDQRDRPYMTGKGRWAK